MKAKHILKEILTAHHEGNSKTALLAMMKQDLMAFSETVKARKITQPLGMIALLRDHNLKWNSVLQGLREAVQGFTYDNNLFLRLYGEVNDWPEDILEEIQRLCTDPAHLRRAIDAGELHTRPRWAMGTLS